jgi:plasmid stability protein
MSTLSIKDVPENWAEVLRQRAARNHRSLQGELMALIEKAVVETSTAAAGVSASELAAVLSTSHAGVDRFGNSAMRRGNKTLEEIAAEHRKRLPKPIHHKALVVDIVRADRDAR